MIKRIALVATISSCAFLTTNLATSSSAEAGWFHRHHNRSACGSTYYGSNYGNYARPTGYYYNNYRPYSNSYYSNRYNSGRYYSGYRGNYYGGYGYNRSPYTLNYGSRALNYGARALGYGNGYYYGGFPSYRASGISIGPRIGIGW